MKVTYEELIPERVRFAVVDDKWDRAIGKFRRLGYTPVAARDIAIARMNLGRGSNIGRYVFYTAENFNYVGGRILVASRDYNPLLRDPKATAMAHGVGNQVWLGHSELSGLEEIADEDKGKPVEERRVLSLDNKGSYSITGKDFGDNELIRFLFKGSGGFYIRWTKDALSIPDIPSFSINQDDIDDVKEAGRPYAKPLLFDILSLWADSAVCHTKRPTAGIAIKKFRVPVELLNNPGLISAPRLT